MNYCRDSAKHGILVLNNASARCIRNKEGGGACRPAYANDPGYHSDKSTARVKINVSLT